MIVQKVLPSLYNGMSEQPYDLRLDNQCDLQVNVVSDLIQGLLKREGSEFLTIISQTNNEEYANSFFTVFEASNGKQYLLIVKEGSNPVVIFDLEQKTLVPFDTSSLNYLSLGSDKPRYKIKTLSTRQGLVILNTNVTVLNLPDLTTGVLKGKVQQFSKLPVTATEGDIYEISGDENNRYTNYYVKYTGGVWLECAKPQIIKSLDSSTMPHVITLKGSEGSEYFKLEKLTYKDRTIGDDNSNPLPSFVNRRINNIFLFRGRMGFLTDDSIVLSKADEYTNFFYGTALEILDDDVIDITIETKTKAKLYHAIPFNRNLSIFSENQQFTLTSGDNLLTPKTASVVPVTYFSLDMTEPIGVGDRIYFTSSVEGKNMLMEYFISGETYNETAVDVTFAVPNLIKDKIDKIVNSTNNNMIFLFSKNISKKIYVYKYFFEGSQKIQSSWSYFEFNYDILNIAIYDNYLLILAVKDGAVVLERVFLKSISAKPKLDRLITVTNGVFDGLYTSFIIPYPQSDGEMVLIDNLGFAMPILYNDNLFLKKVVGDFSSGSYYIGVKYPFRYVFSKPVIKTENKIGITDIKIKINKINISYVNTGYFELLIKPKFKDMMRYIMNNAVVNISELNSQFLITGKEDFIVMNNAEATSIEIYNDTHLPCNILTASFTLNYFLKGRVL